MTKIIINRFTLIIMTKEQKIQKALLSTVITSYELSKEQIINLIEDIFLEKDREQKQKEEKELKHARKKEIKKEKTQKKQNSSPNTISSQSKTQNKIFAKRFYPKSLNVEIGDYAFAGGFFSSNPDAYSNRLGIVAWINPNKDTTNNLHGIILIPDETQAAWAEKVSSSNEDETSNENLNESQKIQTAVNWCQAYCKNGIQKGEAQLPTVNQLRQIQSNRELLNSALRKIGGATLGGWYWSSSEYNADGAWAVDINNGRADWRCKKDNYYVRCILAF